MPKAITLTDSQDDNELSVSEAGRDDEYVSLITSCYGSPPPIETEVRLTFSQAIELRNWLNEFLPSWT